MRRKRSLPTSEITPELSASSAGTGAVVAKKKSTRSHKSGANKPEPEVRSQQPDVTPVVAFAEPVISVMKSPVNFTEEVARLAYRFWEERGRRAGDPVQDWLRAEHEIRSRYTAPQN